MRMLLARILQMVVTGDSIISILHVAPLPEKQLAA
jgi:hypothetical protein